MFYSCSCSRQSKAQIHQASLIFSQACIVNHVGLRMSYAHLCYAVRITLINSPNLPQQKILISLRDDGLGGWWICLSNYF
jgi:hypothetical protein